MVLLFSRREWIISDPTKSSRGAQGLKTILQKQKPCGSGNGKIETIHTRLILSDQKSLFLLWVSATKLT